MTTALVNAETLADLCELLDSLDSFQGFDLILLAVSLERFSRRLANWEKRVDLPPRLLTVYDRLCTETERRLPELDNKHFTRLILEGFTPAVVDNSVTGPRAKKMFERLCEEVARRGALAGIESSALGHFCKIMDKLRVYSVDALKVVGKEVKQRGLADVNAQLVNIVYVMAAADALDDDLAAHVAASLTDARLGELNEVSLGMLVWVFGKMGGVDLALARRLDGAVRARLQTVENTAARQRTLALVPASLVRLGVVEEAMFKLVAANLLACRMPVEDGAAMVDIAWAFASANLAYADVFAKVAQHFTAAGAFASLDAGALAKLAWSFAKVNMATHGDFLDGLIAHCTAAVLKTAASQELTKLAWSFGVLDYAKPDFLNLLANECVDRGLADFSAPELSRIVWNLATLGHVHAGFLNALADELLRRDTAAYDGDFISVVLHAYALLGFPSPALFGALAKQCAERALSTMTSLEVANLAWSFACVGMLGDEAVKAWLALDWAQLQVDNAQDAAEAALFHDVVTAWRVEVGAPLPPLLAKVEPGLRARVDAEARLQFEPGTIRGAIRSELEAMGCTCELGDNGLDVGLVVTVPAREGTAQATSLVLEVTDASNVLSDLISLNGAAMFRRRLLAKLVEGSGRVLKTVKAQQWKLVEKFQERRQKFLAREVCGWKD